MQIISLHLKLFEFVLAKISSNSPVFISSLPFWGLLEFRRGGWWNVVCVDGHDIPRQDGGSVGSKGRQAFHGYQYCPTGSCGVSWRWSRLFYRVRVEGWKGWKGPVERLAVTCYVQAITQGSNVAIF